MLFVPTGTNVQNNFIDVNKIDLRENQLYVLVKFVTFYSSINQLKNMTIKEILKFLDSKNQNLPALSLKSDFKNIPTIFVPVIEDEEKNAKKLFPFLKNQKISGKKGEKLQVNHLNQIYNFTGIGPKKDITSRKMRRFFGSAYLSASGSKLKSIGLYTPSEWVKEAALGTHVAALNPAMLKLKPKKEPVPEVYLINKSFASKATQAKKDLKTGQILAEGKNLMRILGAMPPNVLHPSQYADLITKLAKIWKVKCNRVAKANLKKYNLLNAVSEGSKNDSELLVFTLHPTSGKTKNATAVVGKGLCYDSGGLQSKQNYMKFMKEDMAGSAAVLGTILNIAKGNLKLKETTHFLLPLAESMMGEKAMRADDVYVAGDGQTVEIIHTDAEGRLVMADAICYAKNNFKNTHRFMTIATLTGSCIIALGEHYTGVVCNNNELSDNIEKTGKSIGEHMHIGPWDMDFDDNNSPVADMANLGENDREAGWIKAGLFLYRFVPNAKKGKTQAEFAHFDIAATIDMNEKGKPWRRKGLSSGIGVGALSGILTK
jgi:leucyl aminopeptidase